MKTVEVKNNPSHGQFEVHMDDATAFLRYQQKDRSIYLIHTEVPDEFEGHGIGSALTQAGLDFARENKLRVIPLCPFVQSYLKRHPEYQDLLQENGGKHG
jgi:predicted GNAT family acetyltransferase